MAEAAAARTLTVSAEYTKTPGQENLTGGFCIRKMAKESSRLIGLIGLIGQGFIKTLLEQAIRHRADIT